VLLYIEADRTLLPSPLDILFIEIHAKLSELVLM